MDHPLGEPSIAPSPKRGVLARAWAFVSRPSARFSLGAIAFSGLLFGVLLWGGLHWALERVNNEKFCISCHEMGENNYAELRETIHFKNRSGVRATCPDCHVPKQWLPKMIAKIKASADVYRHVMGRYNTPEKFEEKRARLAQNVWNAMKENDSRECRSCHSADSMDPHKQSATSEVMMLALKNGATCIDCHMGIAHYLPKSNPYLPKSHPPGKRASAKAVSNPEQR
jgi:cytochrome c-type protein NapC